MRVEKLAAALRAASGRERFAETAAAIPAPPDAGAGALLPADLLLVKRFLAGCAQLAGELPQAGLDELGEGFAPTELGKSLGLPPGEGVYFDDCASPKLAAARARLRGLDARLAEIEAGVLADLESSQRLDFRWREFLVVGEERVRELDRARVTVAPCDSHSAIVRPAFGDEHARLAEERSRAVAEEKRLQSELLEEIRRHLDARRYELEACAAALCDLRAALASLRTAESGNE